MKTIHVARCVCGEDVFSDDGKMAEECACGRSICADQFDEKEVADVSGEKILPEGDPVKVYKTLIKEMAVFFDPELVRRYDTLAEMFYKDTGYMAPGKSVPLEMSYHQPPDDALAVGYREWMQKKYKELYEKSIALML